MTSCYKLHRNRQVYLQDIDTENCNTIKKKYKRRLNLRSIIEDTAPLDFKLFCFKTNS